ncbi:MAG: ATP synthase F1 subunit gamma [Minisyncoccia bacterium]|jgi:F-type H+-transporting ATPase subunit gamma
MASTQNLKRRIKSVTNIGTITKAMELVAATKMRRSQELAIASRPYSYGALELMGILAGLKDVPMPDIFTPREIKKTIFIILTSDKGLAGAFNSAVIRKFETHVREQKINLLGDQYAFVAIGQKAKTYLERRKLNIIAQFTRVGDYTRVEEVMPIVKFLSQGYTEKNFDEATIFFTKFESALRQDAVVRNLFPVTYETIRHSIEATIPKTGRYSNYTIRESFFDEKNRDYIIEPSSIDVLRELAPKLLETRLYHIILEANASEHSARRMAMKNASENASELSETLNLDYNKSRQAAITNQIIEVTSGAAAAQ